MMRAVLPSMWPGFDFRTRCRIWIEFVGSPLWDPFLVSPEKPFVKLRLTYSVKMVFSYVVTGIKIKITAVSYLEMSRRRFVPRVGPFPFALTKG